MSTDYSALYREAEQLEARILAGEPVTPPAATPTAPVLPVREAVAPVQPEPAASGAPETNEALDALLMASREAEITTANTAARNEELMRGALRRNGIDYRPERLDAAPATPPVSVPRPGYSEPAAAPMSADTLRMLRLLDHNRPDLDIFGTRIPGSRR
jgi:hypothetical protein